MARGLPAAALAGLLVAAWPGVGRAETPLPAPPDRWVTDGVGLLSAPVRERLDLQLQGYEQQTGHQVLVWIGPTIGGAPLDDWAVRTFASWKVGRKGFDDGLVLFVLPEDRLLDIEVGYGLEGVVPDVVASRIIADVMAPRLREGDADGAVSAGVGALLGAIEGHPVTVTGPVAPPPVALTLPEQVLIGVAVVLFVLLLVTHPRLALWLMWSVASRGAQGGRHGSAGGGSSRGFRGGGGRSGGGGARGSW